MHKPLIELIKPYAAGTLSSAKAIVMWLSLASAIGVIVGAAVSAFGHALIAVNKIRAVHPAIALGLPFGGLAVVLLYRLFLNTGDKGTNRSSRSSTAWTTCRCAWRPRSF